MQRTYFENKLEAKRAELNLEVCVNADLKAKELSSTRESLQKILEERKTQHSNLRKTRVTIEQKIESVRRALTEEESVKENLERHVKYIDTEEDPTLSSLSKEVESQKQLLAAIERKLEEMYQALA